MFKRKLMLGFCLVVASQMFLEARSFAQTQGLTQELTDDQKLAFATSWIESALADIEKRKGRMKPYQNIYISTRLREKISPDAKVAVLEFGAIRLKSKREQICCLKLLIQNHADLAKKSILRIAKESEFVETKCCAINLLGIYRDIEFVDELTVFVEHSVPRIRAAALDAIGFTRKPMNDLGTRIASFTLAGLQYDPVVGCNEILTLTNPANREIKLNDVDDLHHRGIQVVKTRKHWIALTAIESFPSKYRKLFERELESKDATVHFHQLTSKFHLPLNQDRSLICKLGSNAPGGKVRFSLFLLQMALRYPKVILIRLLIRWPLSKMRT